MVWLCVFSCLRFPFYLDLSQVCVRPSNLNSGSLPVYRYLSDNNGQLVDSDPGLFACETRKAATPSLHRFINSKIHFFWWRQSWLGFFRDTMCWNQSAPHCSISYYDQWECYGLLLFVEIRLLGLCSHSRNGMGAAIKSTTMERKLFWWISVGKSEMTNMKTLLSCQSHV